MRSFDEIWTIAAKRKGGDDQLEQALVKPKPDASLVKVADDRWLSTMAKCIFQAGFSWKVVETKWPGFEEAFFGFDVPRVAMFHGEDFEKLVGDTRIIRNGPKIKAVHENAIFVCDVVAEQGGFGKFIADWPQEDYVGLLEVLKKRGSRLGGATGQYLLRFSGKDSFILSRDVVARLAAEGVVDGPTSSKRAMAAIQTAFNTWVGQSGRSLTEISRVLAMSV